MLRSMRMHGFLLAAAIAATIAPRLALADDDAEAKRLFEVGRKALADGKVGQACESFAAAKQLAPSACGVVQNLAMCRQQQGRDRDAYLEFEALGACASSADQPDRVKFADEQRARLRQKVAFLVIRSAADTEHRVVRAYLDGAPLEANEKPQVVEPGRRRVEVERAGCDPLRLEIDALAGQTQSLVLPTQCDARAQTSSQTTESRPPPPAMATVEHVERTRWQLPVGWTAVGVGALAVVASVAPCGVVALNQRDQDLDGAKRTAAICTGFGIAGAAIAAAGVVLLLTAPAATPAAPRSTTVGAAPSTAVRWAVAPTLTSTRDWSLSAAVQF